MSTYAHGTSIARYAESRPDTVLAACCDLDEEKAKIYADKFGFATHYTNMDDMLDREKPDAVSLVVREVETCAVAVSVLSKGYATILEKPPGKTLEEIDAMIAAADKTGAPNRVALNRRYTPLVTKLREMLPTEIQHIRCDFTRVRRLDADFSLTAIHGIDTLRLVAGSDYKQVRFRYKHFPDLGPEVANVLMDCEMESGATAHLNFCPVSGVSTEQIVVHALDHSFELRFPVNKHWEQSGRLTHYEKDEPVVSITNQDLLGEDELWVYAGFYAEHESFYDALRAGETPSGDLRSARQSVAVMQALRERAEVC